MNAASGDVSASSAPRNGFERAEDVEECTFWRREVLVAS
jgi:hypothetical protein